MAKKFLKRGLGLIGGTTIIGSLPDISGSPAETNIKTKTAQGLGKVGATLPTQGKLIGAGMVLKQVKKLKKKGKKLI